MRITSRSNSVLQHVRKLLSSNRYRQETGEFVGDGLKLMEAGFQAEFPFTQLFFSEEIDLPPQAKDFPCYTLPSDLFAWLSPMKSPQGALFVGKQQESTLETLKGNYLLLDGVQDSGNVGTIWRTAQGLGASGLILLEHCASPWSHKTVRSSMGACFHLPVYQMTGEEALSLFAAQNLPLYATALEEKSKSIYEVPLAQCGVVIGSEGQGVRPFFLEQCDETIYLPMAQACQSLNAAMAAGIILWEMGKHK